MTATTPTATATAALPVLELVGGSIRYGQSSVPAVSDVSLALHAGEILGLVGESGCGKSTTARAMLGLVPFSVGTLRLHGQEVASGGRLLRRAVQAIFQNPAASFNPKRTLLDSVAEPLRVRGERSARVRRRREL